MEAKIHFNEQYIIGFIAGYFTETDYGTSGGVFNRLIDFKINVKFESGKGTINLNYFFEGEHEEKPITDHFFVNENTTILEMREFSEMAFFWIEEQINTFIK